MDHCAGCRTKEECLERVLCLDANHNNDDLREMCKGLSGSTDLSGMAAGTNEFIILEEPDPDDLFSTDTL